MIIKYKTCLRYSFYDISESQENPQPICHIIPESVGIFEIACLEMLGFLRLFPSVNALPKRTPKFPPESQKISKNKPHC
jgi:hypothetical protein